MKKIWNAISVAIGLIVGVLFGCMIAAFAIDIFNIAAIPCIIIGSLTGIFAAVYTTFDLMNDEI